MATRHGRQRCECTVLDAAEVVLRESHRPMRCPELVAAILSKHLWATTGKTPAATLNAAIRRDIDSKGKGSRFRQVGKGLFALAR